MSDENRNALWAGAFLDELARAGVREMVVAPGSRSTPLVLAAAALGRFRMIPVLDERSAGFLALGIGKAAGRPAAVLTTSGTAAANLYPAVIEASQAEVPLLLLTADRPRRLRDADANQTMDQLRLFGTFPRGFFEVAPAALEGAALRQLRSLAVRAVALATGTPMGPVHLNLPFEKPLEPAPGAVAFPEAFAEAHPRGARGRENDAPYVRVRPRRASVAEEAVEELRSMIRGAARGVIVAGPVPNPREVGPAVATLGAVTGFPVLADPLSGARFGPGRGAHLVGGYDLFLRSPELRARLAPDLVLRVGASPTSASLLDYLAEHGEARQVVVDDGHRWKDHLAAAHDYLHAPPAELFHRLAPDLRPCADPEWSSRWRAAEHRTRGVLEALPPGELLEGEVVAAVVRALPEGANLLVASSMPIRDLDAFAFPAARALSVFGNRGASGIDGLVSTTAGIAMGASGGAGPADEGATREPSSSAAPRPGAGAPRPPAHPTVALLGDLAFHHDLNGLQAVRALGLPVVLVVINNDGGGIFHMLPVREHEPAFTRFFATPHGLEFRKAAELYGIPYHPAASLGELEEALAGALAEDGPSILEIRTRREETHRRRRQVVTAVLEAVNDLGGGEPSQSQTEPED